MKTTADSDPFASLALLQDEHAALVKEVSRDLRKPKCREDVQNFVRRCVTTGYVLEPSADRMAAQSLVTFWVSRLERAARDSEQIDVMEESEDVLLAEFQQDAFDTLVITPAEKWFDDLPLNEQTLVRRMVLRLLNLRADGTFEAIPNTRTLLEGLEPQSRAIEVLSELIRHGVVRRLRHSLEFEEYSLQPLDRLKNWKALQSWMNERTRFRLKATAAVQSQFAQDDDRAHRPLARVIKFVGDQIQRLGCVMQGLLQATPLFSVAPPTKELVTEAEFEEAENYRDKNAAEVKFIYQKRQLDKQRLVASQERLVGITLTTIGLAVLTFFALVQWRNAHLQSAKAENTADNSMLQVANQQFNQSTRRLVEDPAASMLFAAAALATYDSAKKLLPPERADQLRQSYLLTLGAAESSVPIPASMVFRASDVELTPKQRTKSIKATVLSEQGDVCLLVTLATEGAQASGSAAGSAVDKLRADKSQVTTIVKQGDDKPIPVGITSVDPPLQKVAAAGSGNQIVLEFGTSGVSANGSWDLQALTVPIPSGVWQPDSNLSAYVEGNTRTAALVFNSPAQKSCHLFFQSADEQKPGLQAAGKFGRLLAARFSADGKYFGITTRVEQSSDKEVLAKNANPAAELTKITIYRTGSQWTVVTEDSFRGAGGPIAFAPQLTENISRSDSTSARVAAIVDSIDKPELLCHEWEIVDNNAVKAQKPKSVSFTSNQQDVSGRVNGAKFIEYSTGRPHVLFVSNGGRSDSDGWLVQTDKHIVTPMMDAAFDAEPAPMTTLAFSPNGRFLAIGKKDGRIALWTLSAEELVQPQPVNLPNDAGHSEQIFGLAFSPDNKYLISGGRDKKVMLLDVNARRLASPPIWHSSTVNLARFSPNGRFINTLANNVVYTWELPLIGSLPLSVGVHSGRFIHHETLSSDGKVFAAGGERRRGLSRSGWVRTWESTTGMPVTPELNLDSVVVHVALGDSPRLLSAITQDGAHRVFDADGELIWKNPFSEERQAFATFGKHSRGPRLLVIQTETVPSDAAQSWLRVFEFETSKKTFSTTPLYERSFPFVLSKGQFDQRGERFVAYSQEGRAVVGEIASSSNPHELMSEDLTQPGTWRNAHSEAITHAAFSLDGSRLVTTSEDNSAIVWQSQNSTWFAYPMPSKEATEEGTSIGLHTANVMYASFNTSGEQVVTASADGRGIIWQWSAETARYDPSSAIESDSNSKGMTRAEFMDDRYLLGAWDDGSIRVWDSLKFSISDDPSMWRLNGREVAAFKTTYPNKQFHFERDADDVWTIMALGQTSSNPIVATSDALDDGLSWSAQFNVARWRLAPPSGGRGENSLSTRLARVAHVVAARQLGSDPLQLEPRPLWNVLRDWNERGHTSSLLELEPPNSILAWHIQQAADSSLADPPQYESCLWHWKQLEIRSNAGLPPSILVQRATVNALLGNWQAAEEDLKVASETLSEDPEFLSTRAALNVLRSKDVAVSSEEKSMRLQNAIADYKAVIKRDPQDREARRKIAALYQSTGDDARAYDELNELISTSAATPDADLLQDRATVASRQDGNRLEIFSDFRDAGNQFLRLGRFEDATDALAQALEAAKLPDADSPDAATSIQLAELHEKLGDALLETRKSSDAEQTDSRSTALKHFKLADELEPNKAALLIKIARNSDESLYTNEERPWEMVDHAYQAAMDAAPSTPDLATLRIEALIPKNADDSDETERFEKVAKVYKSIIEPTPTNRLNYLQLACIYVHLRDFQQAEKVLVEAEELLPNDSLVQLRLALVQLNLDHKVDYRKTVARMLLNPRSDATTANNSAWAAAYAPDSVTDFKPWVRLAERALSESKDNPVYFNTLGAVNFRAGNIETAITLLNTATKKRESLAPQRISAVELLCGNALDRLFMAMAQQGQAESEQALDLARNMIREYREQWPDPKTIFDWIWNNSEFELLEKEATEKVRPPDTSAV